MLILPASYADPAILDAVIALGVIHEMHDSNSITYRKDEEDSGAQFTFQQSSEAIRHLTQTISGSAPRSGGVILMFCLDVFLETFQRNHKAALSHLECRLNILGLWLREAS